MALNIIFIMWTVALVANLCVTLKDVKNSKETAREYQRTADELANYVEIVLKRNKLLEAQNEMLMKAINGE